MVAGREATPSEVEATARIKNYWAHGEGAAKIAWGTPGDFDRCVSHLTKYVGAASVKGLCANLHHDATGAWPGHAPGETDGHGHKH